MRISQNIRALRKQKGINQSQLGTALGVTKGAISNYENGNSLPGVETLIKIAQLFGVSIDDLIFGNVEKQARSGSSAHIKKASDDQTLQRVNELLENRVRELEREIKQDNPQLARKLGIK